MFDRILLQHIKSTIDYKKAIILIGARQVGKTTLINQLTESIDPKSILRIDGDDPADRLLWTNPSKQTIQQYINAYKVIIIDEAQRIENIGLTVKIIIDLKEKKQVVLSGSSSIDITTKTSEALTGRKHEYNLFPFSWAEISKEIGLPTCIKLLNKWLIYGAYPEVVTTDVAFETVIKNLANSYLYKDILEYAGIRKPEIIMKLLQALAWQIGSEVSYNELALTVGVNKETIAKYIDLLEKSFVIFKLNPLTRNPRNEISTTRKIYFYDNGIRNAVIDNFKEIPLRNDIGQLWENYFISERLKWLSYNELNAKQWFWRSKAQSEVDYIEEINGDFNAFEIKWNEKAKFKFSKNFVEFYKPKIMQKVDRLNFWNFLK